VYGRVREGDDKGEGNGDDVGDKEGESEGDNESECDTINIDIPISHIACLST